MGLDRPRRWDSKSEQDDAMTAQQPSLLIRHDAMTATPTTHDAPEATSRLSGFYRMDVEERLTLLQEQGRLDASDRALLLDRRGGLDLSTANAMVENLIGVMELPLGLGLNFIIDGEEIVVPMAVEEPSVIAAVSHIAKLTRPSGGFETMAEENIMIGQIQLLGCDDLQEAKRIILSHKSDLVSRANALHPRMQERGGGARDIEVRLLDNGKYQSMVVVHLLIDCCDAMGANLINTMAEGIAPRLEELTGGRAFSTYPLKLGGSTCGACPMCHPIRRPRVEGV